MCHNRIDIDVTYDDFHQNFVQKLNARTYLYFLLTTYKIL
jgi:hypothetical protein